MKTPDLQPLHEFLHFGRRGQKIPSASSSRKRSRSVQPLAATPARPTNLESPANTSEGRSMSMSPTARDTKDRMLVLWGFAEHFRVVYKLFSLSLSLSLSLCVCVWPVSHSPCRPDQLFLTVQCIALFAPGVLCWESFPSCVCVRVCPCVCVCVCVCVCDRALARDLSAHHSRQGGDRIRQLDSLASYPSPRTPQTPQPGMEPEPTATVLTVPW